MRAGLPKGTKSLPTIHAFLCENLRGTAFKSGPTVVNGYNKYFEFVCDRARAVLLYESSFIRYARHDAVAIKNPPILPSNAKLTNGTVTAGAVIIFHEGGLESDKLALLSNARVMGPFELVKSFLRGRKFYVLNRTNEYIGVEVA